MDFVRPNTKQKPQPLELDGATLQPVEVHRSLGILIDQKLSWKPQAQRAAALAKTAAMQLRRIAKPSYGIKQALMRKLYYSTIVPKALYGADVWLTPLHSESTTSAGRKRRKGSAGAVRLLAQAQRIAALAISGALRTAPTDTLEAHLNMLPMSQLVSKHCHRAAVRLCTLPKTHPVATIVRRCSRNYPRRHQSPIHKLMHIYCLRPEAVETISPALQEPWDDFNIKTSIPSRDSAIAQDRENNADVKIYADGSGYENGAGAAAVMYTKDRGPTTLKYHLGKLSKHTVFESEVVGLNLAAHLLDSAFRQRGMRTATISIDNVAAIQSANNRVNKSAQALIHAFRQHIRRILKRTSKTLEIRWIPGHEGVEGNETADEAAKEAAGGETSAKHTLPKSLQQKLPANVAAIKQTQNTKIKATARKMWKLSRRARKAEKLGLDLPSDKYLKLVNKLDRWQASLLTQIRTEHIPLNAYLHRIGKIDRPNCPACGALTETVKHYLLECPAHGHERWLLRRAASRKRMGMMKFALATEEGVKELVKYVNGTERFSRRAD